MIDKEVEFVYTAAKVAILVIVVTIVIRLCDLSVGSNSHKDVVCNGMIVMSGTGGWSYSNGIYYLDGKTYRMKEGESCTVNDSYMNVEVKQ